MNITSRKAEIFFWSMLLVLFVVLMIMHVILFFRPDIHAPLFQHVDLHTVGTTAVVDADGNFPRDPADTNRNLMVNVAAEFSKSFNKHADFVNTDFAKVVSDINSGKRWSNGIAIVGYLLASLPCVLSLIVAIQRKDVGQQ